MTGVSRAPLTWRIPPWQPALLFLIAAGCAAANAYVHVSVVVRIVTIVVGVAALATGIAAARMYLVVDDEGIGVRRLWRERSLDWDDISRVSVVERGFDTLTLRIVSRDGRYLDVPQSLVMPSRPTGKSRVRAQLGDIARQIQAYGEPHRT
ncbi:MAG TPA: PH domain-containing protein [Jatrophihabitantaceae bacterium]|nr:PH domain-containing protein [Jatrophihabitantaceae bacterium]